MAHEGAPQNTTRFTAGHTSHMLLATLPRSISLGWPATLAACSKQGSAGPLPLQMLPLHA